MKKSPIVLIVLDGVGYSENPNGNAVLAANTPNLDSYYKNDADKLNQDGLLKFADKMLTFRTELEIIDEYSITHHSECL